MEAIDFKSILACSNGEVPGNEFSFVFNNLPAFPRFPPGGPGTTPSKMSNIPETAATRRGNVGNVYTKPLEELQFSFPLACRERREPLGPRTPAPERKRAPVPQLTGAPGTRNQSSGGEIGTGERMKARAARRIALLGLSLQAATTPTI